MIRVLCSLVFVLGSAACLFAQTHMIPLQTTIPEEVLAGTPPAVLARLFPDLVPPPKQAPRLLVPKGTTNLALHKKVTSSDALPLIGTLSFVTDGKKKGTGGTFVELGPMKQWVQIDLGKRSTVHAVYVWHYFAEARSYRDVLIQVADDAACTKDVHTIYNNDQDNSLHKGIGRDRPYIETYYGKLIDAKGVKGRYVRLYSSGNTANDVNHYVEVEVFGVVR